MKHIDVAISVGNSCFPAKMLAKAKLREASYPFDWVVSSVNAVYHAITEDFKDYADMKFPGITYPHYKVGEDEEKIQRAVDRFRELWKSDKTLLLCYRASVKSESEVISVIKKLRTLLSLRPNNTYIFATVIITRSTAKPVIIPVASGDDRITLFSVMTPDYKEWSYPQAIDMVIDKMRSLYDITVPATTEKSLI